MKSMVRVLGMIFYDVENSEKVEMSSMSCINHILNVIDNTR